MDEPQLDLLRTEAMPQLAAAFKAIKPEVLARWRTLAMSFLPHAQSMNRLQLEDDLPKILDQLATSIGSSSSASTDQLVMVAPAHGSVRFDQMFRLEELLIEYQFLRRIILELLPAQLDRQLSIEENTVLNAGIDLIARKAAVEFASQLALQIKFNAESQAKYLSFLSHDLRGGLNGVLLMIEVLRRDLQASGQFAESLEDLNVMKRSIHDTVATMDRFLHAEKLRKSMFKIRPAPLDLNRFLHEIAVQFAYVAKEKGNQLTESAPQGLMVETDRELLGIAVQNIVSNAVKYTSRGSITLSAEAGPVPGGATIVVADTGPGIPQDKIQSLFAAYARGDTGGEPGTGLGLSIVRQSADLLGAVLRPTSEPGRGTRFVIELPVRPPENPSSP